MNLTENARMCTFLLVKVDIVHNKGLIVVIPMKPCYNREKLQAVKMPKSTPFGISQLSLH